jgi:hypothetical protein
MSIVTYRVLAITILLSYCTEMLSFKGALYSMRALPRSRNVRLFATKSKSKFVEATAASWDDAKDGMTLVIVESPAKARTIQKFVDEDSFIIDSCAGVSLSTSESAKKCSSVIFSE